MATYEIIIKGDGTAEGGDNKKRTVSPNAKAPSDEKKAANYHGCCGIHVREKPHIGHYFA